METTNVTLKFELSNDDKSITTIQEIHVNSMVAALRLAANDPKRLNELRQAFIMLQWEADDLIHKTMMRGQERGLKA